MLSVVYRVMVYGQCFVLFECVCYFVLFFCLRLCGAFFFVCVCACMCVCVSLCFKVLVNAVCELLCDDVRCACLLLLRLGLCSCARVL